MQSAYSGYDGMLPAFYLLSWPVVALFPHYEYAARWLQIIPALIAPLLIFWWLAKRTSLASAAVAVMPMVWFFSQYTNLAWHLRSYGILLLASAAAIILLDIAPQKRTRKWVALNAAAQLLLVSGQPFGIFYCGLLGVTRWVADIMEHGAIFEKKLMISYIPAFLGVAICMPDILASRELMEPIPWQPTTTLATLQTILLPGLGSLWPIVFIAAITTLLVSGRPNESPKSLTFPLYLTLIPGACLLGTLAVWGYSLHKPLYLDRYFSPNVWAWTIIIALAFWRLERLASGVSRLAALVCAFMFGLLICFHTLHPDGSASTKNRIELTHVLLQGTRDDEIVDTRFPVFLFDFNVFAERFHYNPKTLDYRAVFNVAEQPTNPVKSLVERRVAEGMVALGMNPEKLLTVNQAIETAVQVGGANVLGVKRTDETVAFLEGLKIKGFVIDSRSLDIGGNALIWDVARLP